MGYNARALMDGIKPCIERERKFLTIQRVDLRIFAHHHDLKCKGQPAMCLETIISRLLPIQNEQGTDIPGITSFSFIEYALIIVACANHWVRR